MEEQNTAGKVLSASSIQLRRGETAHSVLMFEVRSKGERTPEEGCLVLTNQRIFHILGAGANAQVKSAPLQDVGTAEVVKQPRYHGSLLAAGYFFVIGIAYLIATFVAGSFQGIVLVPTLVLGGGFLALWWYSGGGTVIRLELGDTQLEGVMSSGRQREESEFLDALDMLKESQP
ncbi:MAG: hypothetical protein ACE5Q6_15290 [Dehalococcoidia bacterium]